VCIVRRLQQGELNLRGLLMHVEGFHSPIDYGNEADKLTMFNASADRVTLATERNVGIQRVLPEVSDASLAETVRDISKLAPLATGSGG